jgi:transcriptional regulator with XRE-family HTH domain
VTNEPTVSAFPGFAALDGRSALVTDLVSKRKERGLSQTEVAADMGTSQSAVARLESGADVRLSTLERYASAIGATVTFGIKP